MTSAVLDPEDRCPTLAYIANTVAKNRTVREIYEREADDKGCPPPAVARRSSGLVPEAAAAPDEGTHEIRAIYVYRHDNARAATAVRQKLNELGYNVPGENDVETRIAQDEVRYFNKRDEAAATRVAQQLAATGTQFVVTDASSKAPGRPGFLEIYVADWSD
jgi:hypothetical protein